MDAEKKANVKASLRLAGILLGFLAGLALVWCLISAFHLSDPEINGFTGLWHAARMELTGKSVARYEEVPPKFLVKYPGNSEDWASLGVTHLHEACGCSGTAWLDGRLYTYFTGAFTSRYQRMVFQEADETEVRRVVFNEVVELCLGRYGCEGPIELADSFDGLNITPDERSDMALTLEELYGVAIPDEELEEFVTLEDMVGYIEDRL